MSLSLLLCQEETSRLNYVLSLNLVPLQISRVALSSYTNVVAVNDELALLNVSLDCTLESTVHCVILEHVSQVIYRAKVVDTYNLNVVASLSCAEYEAADTTKSVNTYFNHFTIFYLKG